MKMDTNWVLRTLITSSLTIISRSKSTIIRLKGVCVCARVCVRVHACMCVCVCVLNGVYMYMCFKKHIHVHVFIPSPFLCLSPPLSPLLSLSLFPCSPETDVFRIVGFEVEPQSVHTDSLDVTENNGCQLNREGLKVMELKHSSKQ